MKKQTTAKSKVFRAKFDPTLKEWQEVPKEPTLEDRFSQLEKRLAYLMEEKVPSIPTDSGLAGSNCLNQAQFATTQFATPILKTKTYTIQDSSLVIVFNRNTKTRATYQEYSAESVKQLISRLDITGCTVEIIPGNYPDLDNIRYMGND